jgi:hypothetical protein
MNIEQIKCENENCENRLRVELNDQSKPVLFCSQTCLNSYLLQDKTSNSNFHYEDPKEVRKLVQNLLSQTKLIQNELGSLRKIRKTYFGLFKDYALKDEVYQRKWSFDDKANQ